MLTLFVVQLCSAKWLEAAFGISLAHIMNNHPLARVIRHLISKP